MARHKILIVEDDEILASLYARALREHYETIVCTTFADARAQIRESQPTALLTDVRLGEFNGLQAAILFRSQVPVGPIVVISGHADEVIRREALRLGATFLVKPVDLARLPSLLSV